MLWALVALGVGLALTAAAILRLAPAGDHRATLDAATIMLLSAGILLLVALIGATS